MPNWSDNVIAFKGSENAILSMLNDALVNSGEQKADTAEQAVEKLERSAKTKSVEGGKIVYDDGLTLRTFLPTPDTFLLYDTTNHADMFAAAAEEQRKQYGVVGWYDYNCNTLGTKWNAELSVDKFYVEDGIATIFFSCQTAWSYPENWITTLEEKYGVKAFILTKEEGGFYYFYGTLDEQIDIMPQENDLYTQYIVDNEEDPDYAAYDEASNDLWYESLYAFQELVKTA